MWIAHRSVCVSSSFQQQQIYWNESIFLYRCHFSYKTKSRETERKKAKWSSFFLERHNKREAAHRFQLTNKERYYLITIAMENKRNLNLNSRTLYIYINVTPSSMSSTSTWKLATINSSIAKIQNNLKNGRPYFPSRCLCVDVEFPFHNLIPYYSWEEKKKYLLLLTHTLFCWFGGSKAVNPIG